MLICATQRGLNHRVRKLGDERGLEQGIFRHSERLGLHLRPSFGEPHCGVCNVLNCHPLFNPGAIRIPLYLIRMTVSFDFSA